jgi:hypothetical protein
MGIFSTGYEPRVYQGNCNEEKMMTMGREACFVGSPWKVLRGFRV